MLRTLFPKSKPVIGMVHLGALPGTPSSGDSLEFVIRQAVDEAILYSECGLDGMIIENMHDVPYLRGGVGPEIVASMAVAAASIRREVSIPVGIQILAAANREALAVAVAAKLDFIRVEGYAFGHIADEGWIESSAAELLRYRRAIGGESIQIWADIKKKHSSHAVTADLSIQATASAVEFMKADAVIVTGTTTGESPTELDLTSLKETCSLPVIVGSGITSANLRQYYDLADGFIVGSHFKHDGVWSNGIDKARVESLLGEIKSITN